MDLHPVEIEALDAFVNGGGRLLLLMNPWRQVMPGEQLRPYIEERFGISIGNDIVITDQRANMWQAELTVDNAPFEGMDDGFMEFRGAYNLGHPITRAFDQTMMLQAARSVTAAEEKPEGVHITELLRTTPDFWAETDTERLLQTGQARHDPGERKGPIPLAAAAIMPVDKANSPGGYSDARVVVIGDADFASNANIIIPGHINFLLNTFAWMSESEDLIAIRPSGREAPPLILTDAQRRNIAWVAIMLTVQATILVGLGVYLIRKRKRQ